MKNFFTSKLKDIKDIKERNRVFNFELSDEEKRKEIAWDSLNLVINGVLTAHRSGYWEEALVRKTKNLSSEALQDKLLCIETNKDECMVCARGAIMVSQIRLGNELSTENLDSQKVANGEGNDGSFDILKGFGSKSFLHIEAEYENNSDIYPIHTPHNLANIFCNIITHGDFDPKDRTDYLEKYQVKIKDIMEIIQSFSDACIYVGTTEREFKEKYANLSEDSYAFEQLKLIAYVLNGNKHMYYDGETYLYYPYFYSKGSSQGFSFRVYNYDDSLSRVSSRLCLKNAKLATYFGKQFLFIWDKYMN